MLGNEEEATQKRIVRVVEFTFVRGEAINEVKLFEYEFVPDHILEDMPIKNSACRKNSLPRVVLNLHQTKNCHTGVT